jgi:hypothetical protein
MVKEKEHIELSYFAYEKSGLFLVSKMTLIDSDKSIETIISDLENGINLYEVIPNIDEDEFKNQSLNYAFFQRISADIDELNQTSSNSYHQIGPALVPHYKIISRDALENKVQDFSIFTCDAIEYRKTLAKNPNSNQFYEHNDRFYPLDKENILILSKNQL